MYSTYPSLFTAENELAALLSLRTEVIVNAESCTSARETHTFPVLNLHVSYRYAKKENSFFSWFENEQYAHCQQMMIWNAHGTT